MQASWPAQRFLMVSARSLSVDWVSHVYSALPLSFGELDALQWLDVQANPFDSKQLPKDVVGTAESDTHDKEKKACAKRVRCRRKPVPLAAIVGLASVAGVGVLTLGAMPQVVEHMAKKKLSFERTRARKQKEKERAEAAIMAKKQAEAEARKAEEKASKAAAKARRKAEFEAKQRVTTTGRTIPGAHTGGLLPLFGRFKLTRCFPSVMLCDPSRWCQGSILGMHVVTWSLLCELFLSRPLYGRLYRTGSGHQQPRGAQEPLVPHHVPGCHCPWLFGRVGSSVQHLSAARHNHHRLGRADPYHP